MMETGRMIHDSWGRRLPAGPHLGSTSPGAFAGVRVSATGWELDVRGFGEECWEKKFGRVLRNTGALVR